MIVRALLHKVADRAWWALRSWFPVSSPLLLVVKRAKCPGDPRLRRFELSPFFSRQAPAFSFRSLVSDI
jgi:hypothetical protein